MHDDVELRVLLLAAFAATCAGPLAAQNEPPRAPRIIGIPSPAAPVPAAPTAEPQPLDAPVPTFGAARRPPNAARLAPLPEARGDTPEEIVVIGQGWRLPDLGSEWRERQKEAASSGRFSATALPLYDPSDPPLRDTALKTLEERRHGYIELFRLRFGRRSRDSQDEQD
jgi:hypothetical protein